MKVNRIAIAFGILAAFTFASCKSTDVEAADDKNEQPAVEETKEDDSEDFSEANKALIEKAEAARLRAVEAKAPTYYADFFKATDGSFSGVKDKFAAEPKNDYSAELNEIIVRFDSMQKASLAQALKTKAATMAESDLDASILKVGEEALSNYDSLCASSGSGKELLAQAEIALKAYDSLVNKGFTAMVGRERKAAIAAKKDAESVKCQVAKRTKDSYVKATEVFKKAESAYTYRNNEAAYNGYKSAKESYITMFETVKKDRADAEAALEKAKQAKLEAEKFAAETDETNPLTEKVAGIEDENAVLLEQDSFANPEDSVIDVESGELAETAAKIADEAIAAENSADNADGGSVVDAK
ncbi:MULTISPECIES: hypothetical protein [Treponema]|uniref:Lipoprotein n=1 Tax=Treponema saccharophilum DSM 2985 TaxID=907348 RepID=H7EHN4_9SPIR|nr:MULTISPECIES: hypothetical protein [Treponema]EIC02910.1 hypothetical protein TresaDRAFT_2664 [Treponema saccharophilum DSM 2985]MBQ5537383.1 hypothetical protein [Treponema sp.]BDC96745.1 hypothetical protein TRSA_18440 [Treponema saccharophilum]